MNCTLIVREYRIPADMYAELNVASLKRLQNTKPSEEVLKQYDSTLGFIEFYNGHDPNFSPYAATRGGMVEVVLAAKGRIITAYAYCSLQDYWTDLGKEIAIGRAMAALEGRKPRHAMVERITPQDTIENYHVVLDELYQEGQISQ